MSTEVTPEPKKPHMRRRELVKYVILIVVISVVVVGFLLLAGPLSGNIFSNIVGGI